MPGLDLVLGGGFPRRRFFLIEGTPGTGKTTLSLQILIEAAKRGERCAYITLSETREELEGVARAHGWDLAPITILDVATADQQFGADEQNTIFHPSEIELTQTAQIVLDEVRRCRPSVVVIDSLSEIRLLAQNPLRFRRQVLEFKRVFAELGCTLWMVDDLGAANTDLQLESLAHGVVRLLMHAPSYGAERRQLIVIKMRGVKFVGGLHDYRIVTGGLFVFPRLVAKDFSTVQTRESFSSGVENLDRLLGGGLDRGTSTVFMGPAGTGKSTMALQFAASAAGQGSGVLYISFDETLDTLQIRASSLGISVPLEADGGLIRLRQVDPAAVSAGELSHEIQRAVDDFGVRMVVLDSLNGYIHAMPDEQFLTQLIHELLTYLNQQGVATILVLTQQGLLGQMETPVALTYLADTVVVLRYFESQGMVRQAVSVIKKRRGTHERTIREYQIRPDGIQVGKPLSAFHGVLSGVPQFVGEAAEMMAPAPSAAAKD